MDGDTPQTAIKAASIDSHSADMANDYYSAINHATYARCITREPALFCSDTITGFKEMFRDWEAEAKTAREAYKNQLSSEELDALRDRARHRSTAKAEAFIAATRGMQSSEERQLYETALASELERAWDAAQLENNQRNHTSRLAQNLANSPFDLHR